MQFIGGGGGGVFFLVKIKSKENMFILTNWSVRKVTFFLLVFFLRRGECLPILGHKDLIQSKYTPV